MYAPQEELHVPVLIVGGSIVGLSLSLFLAHHGVAACTVERHHSTALHPRARGFHERTIELFRASGVAAQLEQLGSAMPTAAVSCAAHSGTCMFPEAAFWLFHSSAQDLLLLDR